MPSNDLTFNVYALDRASKTFLSMAEKVDRLGRKLDELDRKEANPRVDVKTRKAVHDINHVNHLLSTLSLRKAAVTGGIIMAPSAVGALTALTAGLAGAVGLFGTAGTAAGGFGVAAAGSLKRVLDARKELNKANADTEAILGSLSDAQRDALRSINELSGSWSKFLDRNDAAVLGSLTDGMDVLKTLLSTIDPLVQTGAAAFGHFSREVNGLLNSGGWSDFVGDSAAMAEDILPHLGGSVLNVAEGIGHLVRAFSGLGSDMAKGLEGITADFEQWSDKLAQSEGFHDFVSYVEQVGPEVVQTVKDIAGAIIAVGEAIGPLAGPSLKAIQALSNALKAIAQSDAGPPLLAAAAGMVAVNSALRKWDRAKAVGMVASLRNMSGRKAAGMVSGIGAIAIALHNLGSESVTAADRVGAFASGALTGAIFAPGGPIIKGIGALAGGLLNLGLSFLNTGDSAKASAAEVASFAATLDDATGKVTQDTLQWVEKNTKGFDQLSKNLDKVGVDLGTAAQGLVGYGSSAKQVTSEIQRQIDSTKQAIDVSMQYADGTAASSRSTESLRKHLKFLQGVMAAYSGAVDHNTKVHQGARNEWQRDKAMSKGLKDALDTTKDSVDAQTSSVESAKQAWKLYQDRIKQVKDEISKLQAFLSFRAALRNQATAVDDARKQVKDYIKEHGHLHRTLDISKADENKLQAALDQVATSTLNAAQQAASHGKTQDRVNGIMKTGRQRLIHLAEELGFSSTQAKRLADKLGLIPDKTNPEVKLKGASATKHNLDVINGKLNYLDGKTAHTYVDNVIKQTHINVVRDVHVSGGRVVLPADGGTITNGYPMGGTIPGQRLPYGDKVPAVLAPGEEVISNRHGQADKWRPLLKAINADRMASAGTTISVSGGSNISVDVNLDQIRRALDGAELRIDPSLMTATIDTRAAGVTDGRLYDLSRTVARGRR